MELYLDTADVAAVKRLARVLPLQGVTTNPSILAKAGKSLWEVLPALRDALGGTGKLFAQVLASDSERMVSEAVQLSEQIPGLVIKIPVTAEGLAAIKKFEDDVNSNLGYRGIRRRARAIIRVGGSGICRTVCQSTGCARE